MDELSPILCVALTIGALLLSARKRAKMAQKRAQQRGRATRTTQRPAARSTQPVMPVRPVATMSTPRTMPSAASRPASPSQPHDKVLQSPYMAVTNHETPYTIEKRIDLMCSEVVDEEITRAQASHLIDRESLVTRVRQHIKDSLAEEYLYARTLSEVMLRLLDRARRFVHAEVEQVVAQAQKTAARKMAASAAAATVQNETSDESSTPFEHFDVRDAVLYSEVLRPKFEE